MSAGQVWLLVTFGFFSFGLSAPTWHSSSTSITLESASNMYGSSSCHIGVVEELCSVVTGGASTCVCMIQCW